VAYTGWRKLRQICAVNGLPIVNHLPPRYLPLLGTGSGREGIRQPM
jgi:hypothetical protein